MSDIQDPTLCTFGDAGKYGLPMGKTKRYAEIARGNHPRPLELNGRSMFVVAELRAHAAAEIEKARRKAADDAERRNRSDRARAIRRGESFPQPVAA